jgi:hypothetical protein
MVKSPLRTKSIGFKVSEEEYAPSFVRVTVSPTNPKLLGVF